MTHNSLFYPRNINKAIDIIKYLIISREQKGMKRLKPNLDLYIHEKIFKKFPHISNYIFIYIQIYYVVLNWIYQEEVSRSLPPKWQFIIYLFLCLFLFYIGSSCKNLLCIPSKDLIFLYRNKTSYLLYSFQVKSSTLSQIIYSFAKFVHFNYFNSTKRLVLVTKCQL